MVPSSGTGELLCEEGGGLEAAAAAGAWAEAEYKHHPPSHLLRHHTRCIIHRTSPTEAAAVEVEVVAPGLPVEEDDTRLSRTKVSMRLPVLGICLSSTLLPPLLTPLMHYPWRLHCLLARGSGLIHHRRQRERQRQRQQRAKWRAMAMAAARTTTSEWTGRSLS